MPPKAGLGRQASLVARFDSRELRRAGRDDGISPTTSHPTEAWDVGGQAFGRGFGGVRSQAALPQAVNASDRWCYRQQARRPEKKLRGHPARP